MVLFRNAKPLSQGTSAGCWRCDYGRRTICIAEKCIILTGLYDYDLCLPGWQVNPVKKSPNLGKVGYFPESLQFPAGIEGINTLDWPKVRRAPDSVKTSTPAEMLGWEPRPWGGAKRNPRLRIFSEPQSGGGG